MRTAIQDLRAKGVDLVVLLSHLGLRGDKDLILEVEGIDLIFGGHSRAHQEDPVILGDVAIFQAGSRGKYLGQVQVELIAGGRGWTDPQARARVDQQRRRLQKQLERSAAKLEDPMTADRGRIERMRQFTEKRLTDLVLPPEDDGTHHRLTSEKIAMSRSVADEAGMRALVDGYLERLGEEPGGADPHAGHDHGKLSEPPLSHPSAGGSLGPGGGHVPIAERRGPYVGAQACLGCHPVQYADWSKSGHARAYATLVAEKRNLDLDCWSCHVTGAGRPGGPQGPADVQGLTNVQCEACHGPGQKHIQSPVDAPMFRRMAEEGCKGCHSDEQTMGRFVYADYLPKVDHKSKSP